MPYFNTNNIDLAVDFCDYINKKMLELRGYQCAKLTSRIEQDSIDTYGKYRVGLNVVQSEALGLEPENSSLFTENEIIVLLNNNHRK